MTKQAQTNGFVKDTQRMFTMSDKTVNKSLQYHVTKGIIGHLEWSIDNKEKIKANLNDEALDMIRNKNGDVEGAPTFDEGRLIQLEQDWHWHNDQQAVAEDMLAYFKQASQQLFPEQHEASQKTAASAIDFFTKSA